MLYIHFKYRDNVLIRTRCNHFEHFMGQNAQIRGCCVAVKPDSNLLFCLVATKINPNSSFAANVSIMVYSE